MRISTKGRYGLQALLDLALHSDGTQVPLLSIAQRQNISTNYLEQVFSLLRKAKLVNSVKGAQGGYILADSPAHIRVGTVLRALEGDLKVVDDDLGGVSADKENLEPCIRAAVWDKINASIDSVVDSITLEDLVDEFRGLNDAPMFYI